MMKIHHLKSATIVVESNGTKILCDPWLIDGEYYGSWFHYPPYSFNASDFNDIDYIYISHIHPDHLSKKTLEKLDKSIPVLIHKYNSPFLKANIERLNFKVIELEHNKRTHLENGVYINILAADDCNPELCLKHFGCQLYKSTDGSAQIDSLSVIDDGSFTFVNVNDCPLQLAETAAKRIKVDYKKIDFLAVGYAGAGPYPQCFTSFTDEERIANAHKKKIQFLTHGLNYLNLFKPSYFMPFAGTYVLGGSLAKLNDYRGVPELFEALEYLDARTDSNGILLNSNSYFNLETAETSDEYIPVDIAEKKKYIEESLAGKQYDFETNPMPSLKQLEELILKSYERMNGVRKSISFTSPTFVIIPLVEEKSAKISVCGEGVEIIDDEMVKDLTEYVQLKVNPKLLELILKGPRFAHWNNAEIGSHIEYFRKPEKFERGLYYSMNFFHS